jgi:hypothetical protein
MTEPYLWFLPPKDLAASSSVTELVATLECEIMKILQSQLLRAAFVLLASAACVQYLARHYLLTRVELFGSFLLVVAVVASSVWDSNLRRHETFHALWYWLLWGTAFAFSLPSAGRGPSAYLVLVIWIRQSWVLAKSAARFMRNRPRKRENP